MDHFSYLIQHSRLSRECFALISETEKEFQHDLNGRNEVYNITGSFLGYACS